MSLQVARHRIRLQCDAISTDAINCLLRDTTPKVWCGVDLQIEVGLYWNGTFVDDLSNIDSLVLEIHTGSDRDSAPLVQETLSSGDLDTGMTEEEWESNASDQAHATFTIAHGDLALDLSDADNNELDFWLVVHAVTNDGTPRYITWGGTKLTVVEDGAQLGLAVVTAPDPAYRLNDGELQLWNPDQSKWHTLYVKGASGAEYLAIGPGES